MLLLAYCYTIGTAKKSRDKITNAKKRNARATKNLGVLLVTEEEEIPTVAIPRKHFAEVKS